MILKKLAADLLFTGHQLLPNAVLICSDNGTIKDIIDNPGDLEDVQRFKGLLSPGFINTHCHTELSHLKGAIPEKTGLDGFIKSIEAIRHTDESEILDAIEEADREMFENGIVAVGDISNTNHSFLQKSKSSIYYHTFIEVLGFHPERAETAFNKALGLSEELRQKELSASITIHAPYSASQKLIKLVSDRAYEQNDPLTIHMQESEEENLLFLEKRGKILDRLEGFGINTDHFAPTGFSSLKSTLIHFPRCNRIQLVHNTFTTDEEIRWATDYSNQLYWCFCPNANLYIEDRLPKFDMFFKENVRCTIGTDSLASNNQLDLLEELKIIEENSHATLIDLLKSITLNGAEFLGIQDRFGSFEKGKRPGVNLVSVDSKEKKLTGKAEVKRII